MPNEWNGPPPMNGDGPPPPRKGPDPGDIRSTSSHHSASPLQRNAAGQANGKRRAGDFWATYYSFDDPGDAWTLGYLELDGLVPGQRVGDRFDLPPEVIAAWTKAADHYAAFAEAVEDFETIATEDLERWRAARRGGVPA